MERYLVILIDSLHKKIEILKAIQSICNRQESLVGQMTSDPKAPQEYNELMVKKGELIEQLGKLDDGFTALYARISPELRVATKDYSEQISTLQTLISDATERTTLIQAQELRIQSAIDRLAGAGRSGKVRHVARDTAAQKYHQTMQKSAIAQSIFIDNKRRNKHES